MLFEHITAQHLLKSKSCGICPQLNSFLKGPLVQQRLDSSVFARKTIKDSTVKTSDATGITPLSIVTISPYGRHYHQKAPHADTPVGHIYNIIMSLKKQILSEDIGRNFYIISLYFPKC